MIYLLGEDLTPEHMWRIECNLVQKVLSFHFVGSRSQNSIHQLVQSAGTFTLLALGIVLYKLSLILKTKTQAQTSASKYFSYVSHIVQFDPNKINLSGLEFS